VIYLSTARYQKALGQSNLSLIERIAPDVGANSGISSPSSRFYELYTAFETAERHPLFGVGAWGEFEVNLTDAGRLDYHQGDFSFVHSGFGHVLLKSGLIGLVLFSGMLFSAWRFAARARANVPERHLALFDSCRAGLVFMLPSLLVGGPIVEFRSMALLGILLAVPVAISKVARSQQTQSAITSGHTMAHAVHPFRRS
jgi:O-antigen ligase